jgi:hypothetical protein
MIIVSWRSTPLDMAAPMAGFHLVVCADPARSRQGIKYAGRPEVGGGRGWVNASSADQAAEDDRAVAERAAETP